MAKIPRQIIDAMNDRKCLFFIGSGMSTEAGLPSATDLTNILIEKLKSNGVDPTNKQLKKVAQDFIRRFSRPKLKELIRDKIVKKLETADKTSFNLLTSLVIKPKDIVTTNWDPLIEEAIGRNNYAPIFEPNAVADSSESKINLFKIHGDIDHDIVITEDDYRNYSDNWGPIITELKALFQKRTIVFIGYSTDDENFLDMYMEVHKELGANHLLPRYCVDPNFDEIKTRKMQERGIRPIQMPAREFLEKLDEELREGLSEYKLPSPKTVLHHPAPPSPDNNPFGIFRAEEIPDEKWINATFVPPIDFTTIVDPGNVVIEGHRGSGKSIILQYMSYPSFIAREDLADYIGFYVKLQNSYVDTVNRREMEKEEWKEFFLHYFNLLIGESILITLTELIKREKIEFKNEKEFVKRVLFRYFSDLPTGITSGISNINTLLDLFIKERNGCAKYPRPTDFRLSPHFVYDFTKLLEDYVEGWENKFFYILLDEYDKLDEDQQKVINIYLADRGAPLRYRVSFKIAVKLFQMSYETIDGKMLDLVDDYQWIPLDRFDKTGEEDFIKKLKEIGNTRLRVYGYKNESIDEVFPSGGKSFEEGDYSGIDNLLILSSYLVRDFLELAKDMLYYACPWIISEKRERIPEVPPYIQNLIINVHSNALYTTGIDGISGKIGDKERKYLARLLIGKLGVIFQRILKGSRSAEKRTVSSFQLKDAALSEVAKTSLEDCRDVRCLQVPYTVRVPQNYARHAPHRKYEFHRLLCPRFRLSLARRWPREISATQFNKIFESPDDAVDELTEYFLTNIFVDESVEYLIEMSEVNKLKSVYQDIYRVEHDKKDLFGKFGDAKIERTLTGASLKLGSKSIQCESEDEAQYMKVFADMGLKEAVIPKDPHCLEKIIPDIKELKETIDRRIKEELEEYPAIKKKKDKIIPEIWMNLLEVT